MIDRKEKRWLSDSQSFSYVTLKAVGPGGQGCHDASDVNTAGERQLPKRNKQEATLIAADVAGSAGRSRFWGATVRHANTQQRDSVIGIPHRP